MFPKTQDDTIDRLLRAQGGGSGNPLPPCREFDADLANAYVERGLTAGELAGYEHHLAACSPCRKTVVALTRMAQADSAAAPAVAAVVQTQGASRLRQWLGALTAPQWAMVATAVVVLAVSLPLALSRRTTLSNEAVAVKESPAPPSSGEVTAKASAPASATSEAQVANGAREADAPQGRAAGEKPSADEKKEAAAQPATPADSGSGAATALAQTAEPKPAEPVAAKTEAPAPTAAPAAEAAQPQASDEASRLAKEKQETKDAAAKPGSEKRAEADSAVAGNIAPPPPPPSRDAESSRARARRDEPPATGPAISSFRPSSEAVTAPRGPSRKINGHLFWLRGNIWTDKDYNPDKDKPVTIIRDSEVYRSLLTRYEKIKPFLVEFPADARVIFKFKGMVYKLVPQDADR